MTATVVREYAAELTRERAAALGAIAAAWSRMSDDFDVSWATIRPQVLRTAMAAQLELAELTVDRMPAVIARTAPGASAAEYAALPAAWLGVAGDGRPLESLVDLAPIQAKRQVAAGAPPVVALESAGKWLTTAVGTALSDTHRGIEQMAGHARKVGLYVRQLNPPSCGRCVILAGIIYKSEQAFERHPGCDCIHVPAAGGYVDDRSKPDDYLRGLDDDELARALGSKANAQAWRDGADPNQLINAYRRKGSVQKAQIGGKTVKFTHEGMTKRGFAYKRILATHGAATPKNMPVRIMPSTIYELASDREDAKRLLHTYGWITSY